MTTYLEQINKKIDVNTRKLVSLEEYKQDLLSKEGTLDSNVLAERLEQINEEYNALQNSIRVNSKAKIHYEEAYKQLLELRDLDSALQHATDSVKKAEIEQDIIWHTEELQKHLTRLPEKLIVELQQKYLSENQNTSLAQNSDQSDEITDDSLSQNVDIPAVGGLNGIANDVEPIVDEPVIQEKFISADDAPIADSTADTIDANSDNDGISDRVFDELLQIFDAERNEMNEIGVFDNASQFEDFLEKYKNLKMECHARLLAAIEAEFGGYSIESDPVDSSDHSEELPEELIEIPVTGEAPIIIMLDLVDKLEIMNNSSEKLHSINIEISDSFKEELAMGNWLYNVVHYAADLASVTEQNGQEFIDKLSNLDANRERIEILNRRINNLSRINLAKVYNEYYAKDSQPRITTALKVLLGDAINKLV